MRVLIAGASRGLGYCLVKLFAEKGHEVYAGIRFTSKNEKIEKLRQCYSQNIKLLDMDVTNSEQVHAAAESVIEDGGLLDVLIYNAGVITENDRYSTVTEIIPEDLRYMLEVNVIGSACVLHEFHNKIVQGGFYIVITSEAGSTENSGTHYCGYTISKMAQNKLVSILYETHPEYTVYAIHPGRMNTDMGKFDAQIEPEESAEGIYRIVERKKILDNVGWFINYRGEKMTV